MNLKTAVHVTLDGEEAPISALTPNDRIEVMLRIATLTQAERLLRSTREARDFAINHLGLKFPSKPNKKTAILAILKHLQK